MITDSDFEAPALDDTRDGDLLAGEFLPDEILGESG